MQSEKTGRPGDVPPALDHHAFDVLPFHLREGGDRRGGRMRGRTGGLLESRQELVDVRRLGEAVERPERTASSAVAMLP